MSKTTCSVSRSYFQAEAKPLTVTITDSDGKVVFSGMALPTEFSTKSLGYNISSEAAVPVGPIDRPMARIGLNITLIGSKELPPAPAARPTATVTAPKLAALTAGVKDETTRAA